MRAGPVNCQILLGGERDRTGPLAGASRAYANMMHILQAQALRSEPGAREAQSTEHGEGRS